tara:strand:- start:19008 stop:19244 length:237 start_codon:yes stop_codon:yes gene_type:complete
MPKFLIYDTEQEAWDKAEEEGQALDLPFWQNPENITKVVTAPMLTNDGEWALEVTDYETLTMEEELLTVEELNMEEVE